MLLIIQLAHGLSESPIPERVAVICDVPSDELGRRPVWPAALGSGGRSATRLCRSPTVTAA